MASESDKGVTDEAMRADPGVCKHGQTTLFTCQLCEREIRSLERAVVEAARNALGWIYAEHRDYRALESALAALDEARKRDG